MREDGWKHCLVNYVLIAVNVLVFASGLLTGSAGFGKGNSSISGLYLRGALYAPLLLKGKDFYRLLTAVFLHADAAHLFNNMIVQFAGGTILEKRVGHVRFAVIYFGAGILGNLVSVASDYVSGSYGVSVGASGAVFGVMGALVWLILRAGIADRREGGTEGFSGKYRSLLLRTVIMTAYLLYSGWENPTINQAAHIGGILSGFLLCALLMRGRETGELHELLR